MLNRVSLMSYKSFRMLVFAYIRNVLISRMQKYILSSLLMVTLDYSAIVYQWLINSEMTYKTN